MLVQKDFVEEFNRRNDKKIKFLADEYSPSKFIRAVKGYEDEREGGERCHICYEMRLDSSAQKALELGYDYFASALTISPKKNAQIINETGYVLQEQDFKEVNKNARKFNNNHEDYERFKSIIKLGGEIV